ncbi:MAG: serpin family protein [Ruminococcaceae bacterium]|nr:serpin family protein [Oscillospiraceae bacterium]
MKRILKHLSAVLAVVLVCSVLVTTLVACTPSNAASNLAIAKPVYPEAVKAPGEGATDKDFDAYQAYNEKRIEAGKGNPKAMKAFYKKTLAQVLGASKAAGSDSGKNAVYSPINVYLALAMLAETTDGNSRQQLLDLLGEKSISSLRKRVQNLFIANYQDDGECTSLLANSLWMNEALQYNQKTLETLAKKHYAYSFAGKPGSKEMNKALQGWINEQTHDLLKDQAASLELDPSTVLALVSTIYYKAVWSEQFNKEATDQKTFHVPTGDKKVDMMHLVESFPYYTGKNFEAVALPLRNSGSMWFFLPKKGVTPAKLASDAEVLSLLTDTENYKDFSYPQVTLSLPKMDAVSDTDLIKDLKKLGVTDIFGSGGNFSPLMEDAAKIFVSQIEHAARVKTDEDGVEAAAFTAIVLSKAAMPTQRVTFTVDRPYYFAITGYTGDLLFTGVVNDPAAVA